MILKRKFPIILGLIIFYCCMSAPILLDKGTNVLVCGLLFVIVSAFVIYRQLFGDITKHLIPLFAYTYYFIYMTMAQLYLINSTNISEDRFCYISLLVSGSILLLQVGSFVGRNIRVKTARQYRYDRKSITYFVLLIFALFVTALKIRAAGGIAAYFGASYQGKYSSVSTEKALGGLNQIIKPFAYYNLMFLSHPKWPVKWSARIYFVFNILMIYASGSSLAILYQLIGFCCVQVLGNTSVERRYTLTKKQRKWIMRSAIALGIGVVVAILIRFNRSSDTFSFNVLSNAYELLISTSTFDALKYFNLTLQNMRPTWTPGQFIFAFIFFIPRSIFPMKATELGRIVATTFMSFNETLNGGFAVTPMAEFYYDFGMMGVFMGMIFLGVLLEIIQKKIPVNTEEGNKKYTLVVVLMFMFTTVSLPASWTNMGSTMMGTVIFLCMERILNKLKI